MNIQKNIQALACAACAATNVACGCQLWHEQVRKLFQEQNSGRFVAQDAHGAPVSITWGVADIKSPALAAFKQEICDFASTLTAETESAFARAYPEAVAQEHFLAACAPLFEKGIEQVDWQAVRETIKKTVTDFYHMDISSFGEEVLKPLMADLWFFASLRDAATGELLGFVQFAVTPALAQGEVKLMQVTVAPSAQKRGLEQLLLGLIFKLIPGTKRLFTGVRPTNTVALGQLRSCCFVPDAQGAQDPNHPINPDYWTLLQYVAEQSKLLQDSGECLQEAKGRCE